MNYLFQRYITRGALLSDDYFNDKLIHAADHLRGYAEFTGKKYPSICMELGTGWYPVIPIALFLGGSDKVYTTDINHFCTVERITATIYKFLDWHKQGRLSEHLSYDLERLNELEQLVKIAPLSVDEMMRTFGIFYLVGTHQTAFLPDSSVDLIVSNNTLEHVKEELIRPIFNEFLRILKPGNGFMSHFIDMSDHFAHFDRSITIYNFLKFSPWQWKLIDNDIQPQNRLRYDDYMEIYDELGIPISKQIIREGSEQQLSQVRLHKKFADKEDKLVAISHCHFFSHLNTYLKRSA